MKNKRINRKLACFTLSHETIKILEEFSKKKSINKSRFIDRIINEEIERDNEKR